MFLCTIAISLSRVVLLLAPFWFTELDQKKLAVGVITSLTMSSTVIILTGYRLVTRDYSDPVWYKIFLYYWGVEQNQKLKHGTNYPEFSVVLTTAVLLYIFIISLEWKMNVYNALNNRVQDVNIGGDNILNYMIPVPANHQDENSEVTSTRATTSVQGQDNMSTADRNLIQEDTFPPTILVQEQVATVDIHQEEFASAVAYETIHDIIINCENGKINREETSSPVIVTSSKFSQKSRRNPKKVHFSEVQEKVDTVKDQMNVSTSHYQSNFLAKIDLEDIAAVDASENATENATAALNIKAIQAVPSVAMVTELPTLSEVKAGPGACDVPTYSSFSGVQTAQVDPVDQGVLAVPAAQVDPVVPEVPLVSAAQVDKAFPAAQLFPGPAVRAISAPTLQHKKLKAFWTFICKGSFVGLWLCLSEVLYTIHWLAIENEKDTYYTSFLGVLYWWLSLILLFPYLILSNQDPKAFVQRIISNWARFFCSWSWVPSSVASFVLSRLPD